MSNTVVSPVLSTEEVLGALFGFSLLWGAASVTGLHFFERRKGDEYASRVVSIVHAFSSVILCAVALLQDTNRFGCFTAHATLLEQIACLNSSGYFVVDFIGMWFGSYYDTLFIWHHIGAFACLMFAPLTQTGGNELVITLLLMEVSNPFLHGRWVYLTDHNDVHDRTKPMYRFLDEGFMYVFTAARLAGGPIVTANYMLCPGNHWLLASFGTLMQLMSFKFFVEVMQKRREQLPWK